MRVKQHETGHRATVLSTVSSDPLNQTRNMKEDRDQNSSQSSVMDAVTCLKKDNELNRGT